jgi:glycosyltransferase involved in cell wall biosynthesis
MVANLCRIKNITPMLTGLGYNLLDTSSNKALLKKITRGLLRISLSNKEKTRVILHNTDDYNTLLNFGILNKKSKAFVVNGSGVDLSHYNYTKADTNNVIFLMIARLVNAKGVREFYESATLLRQKFPEARFRLIGQYDNNIDSISRELFKKIQTEKIIEFLGPVDDVRPFIKDSSVVVLPSYYEGLPRCILEAMAMGRAVITSDSVGCRETVNQDPNNVNGFLVPIKDPAALASKMEHFILNQDDIVQFGINGRKYAEEKYDVHVVNKQMLSVIEAN